MTRLPASYDSWRLYPPDLPDYSDAELEKELPDLFYGILGCELYAAEECTGLYDGYGNLFAVRVGKQTLPETQIRALLSPEHFARIQSLDGLELRQAINDWEEAMADRVRDNAEGRE